VGIVKRTALARRTPLRPKSKKRQQQDVQRRKLVALLLETYPWCQVPWCDRRSLDIHEPLTRARGGSILDPANCVAVCRLHHDLIHAEPQWAYDEGLLKHSWDAQ